VEEYETVRNSRQAAFPNSYQALNGMGLWSNFKYLPNADWVNHAQARERG